MQVNSVVDNLNASEALFAFLGWLTTRDGDLTIGAKHDVGEVVDLTVEFIKAQGLPGPREKWHEFVVPMED